ncbi:MAG: uracil-DNA glycosylase [Cyanobacteria bacterium]|nr:uracil-DNA glycosylase [Cyanobacteriota bacterium]
MNKTLENTLLAAHSASLASLQETVQNCHACLLSKGRTQTVFGEGNPNASVVLIGEGPGQQEDETGRPFVGRAGKLLTEILASVDLQRDRDIYICNVVKCRPPNNRAPLPEEVKACSGYLLGQIAAIKPAIILLCGSTALKSVLGIATPISKVRGQWLETPFGDNTLAMAIFHPSYLLRNPSKEPGSPKYWMWQDMKALREKLNSLKAK